MPTAWYSFFIIDRPIDILRILLSGLEAELYYVREGVVNTYAMNFVVPVPANIADLEFSWQSLVGHPVRIYMH